MFATAVVSSVLSVFSKSLKRGKAVEQIYVIIYYLSKEWQQSQDRNQVHYTDDENANTHKNHHINLDILHVLNHNVKIKTSFFFFFTQQT